MEIKFTVPGNPKALKRHRDMKPVYSPKTNKWFTPKYDPSSGDKSTFLAIAMQNKPEIPFDCPLSLELTFIFDRPKSHYRTGRYARQLKDVIPIYYTPAPDCDNLAKFVCDALNGIFWKDDRIISKLTVLKIYSTAPKTEVTIKTI